MLWVFYQVGDLFSVSIYELCIRHQGYPHMKVLISIIFPTRYSRESIVGFFTYFLKRYSGDVIFNFQFK